MTILGRSHPLVREIRSLRRSRAARDARGVFLAEGLHLAGEALASGAEILTAIVSPAIERVEGGTVLRGKLESAGVDLREGSDTLLDSLQDARSAQPVLLLVRRPPNDPERALDGRVGRPLVVVADGLQDPGNLGSILRTADAAGATGLLVTGESADLFHPRTVRATMGSIFRLPVAVASADTVFAGLSARKVATVAADPSSELTHDAFDLSRPVACLFGREGGGLRAELLSRVDARVRIPMAPGVDSLSVGAAVAVLLYEARRQRP